MVNPFYQSVNFLSIAHIAIGRYFIDREDIAKMKDVDVGPIGGCRIRPCVLLQVGFNDGLPKIFEEESICIVHEKIRAREMAPGHCGLFIDVN